MNKKHFTKRTKILLGTLGLSLVIAGASFYGNTTDFSGRFATQWAQNSGRGAAEDQTDRSGSAQFIVSVEKVEQLMEELEELLEESEIYYNQGKAAASGNETNSYNNAKDTITTNLERAQAIQTEVQQQKNALEAQIERQDSQVNDKQNELNTFQATVDDTREGLEEQLDELQEEIASINNYLTNVRNVRTGNVATLEDAQEKVDYTKGRLQDIRNRRISYVVVNCQDNIPCSSYSAAEAILASRLVERRAARDQAQTNLDRTDELIENAIEDLTEVRSEKNEVAALINSLDSDEAEIQEELDALKTRQSDNRIKQRQINNKSLGLDNKVSTIQTYLDELVEVAPSSTSASSSSTSGSGGSASLGGGSLMSDRSTLEGDRVIKVDFSVDSITANEAMTEVTVKACATGSFEKLDSVVLQSFVNSKEKEFVLEFTPDDCSESKLPLAFYGLKEAELFTVSAEINPIGADAIGEAERNNNKKSENFQMPVKADDQSPSNNSNPSDYDQDGVADSVDNCPIDSNSSQMDSDGDGKGDACDSYDGREDDKKEDDDDKEDDDRNSYTNINYNGSSASSSNSGGHPFSDVYDHWSEGYVEEAYQSAWVEGVSSSKFAPNDRVNVAAFVKMLMETTGLGTRSGFSEFSVNVPSWFEPYLVSAETADIVRVRDGLIQNFSAPLTRCDASLYMARAYNVTKYLEPGDNPFVDLDDNLYCAYAIVALYEQDVVSGFSGGEFRPFDYLTRAEALSLLINARENL